MTWLPDALRWAAVGGWATLMLLTTVTVACYFRARSLENRLGILRAAGLLPSHVVSLGLILAGFATEAVLVNVSRLGEPIGPVNIINPVLFGVACHGMWLVARFEHRRWVNLRRQVRPTLPSDREGGAVMVWKLAQILALARLARGWWRRRITQRRHDPPREDW